MSCNSYEGCINRERENMRYPIDNESLYMHRIFDNQTANRRCYERDPIEIVEGFGFSFTWESFLKFLVIVLLIILFVILIKDSIFPKEQVNIGVPEATELRMSTVKV